MPSLTVLAVTGGIGSGKSLLCGFLEERGFPVYDSDSRTKALYKTDRALAEKIREVLSPWQSGPASGNFLLEEDGSLSTRQMAQLVFGSEHASEAMAALETVVHPAVLSDFLGWKQSREVIQAAKYSTVVMESAIVLQKPLFHDAIDKVLLVRTPLQERIRRAAMRDGVPPEQIAAREAAQVSEEDSSFEAALHMIDYIIENDGTPDMFRSKVDEFIELNFKK